MDNLNNQIYENSRMVIRDACQKKFLIKLIILFFLYLISNYLFDLIDNDDLTKTFAEKPYIIVRLPNNTIFKMLLTFTLIIITHYLYSYLIKPFVCNRK